MKINKIFAIIFCLASVVSYGYFWENFSQPTEEQIEKRKIDLEYQQKASRLQQQKANVAAEARKRQQNINYKQSQLELQRKEKQLKLQ